MRLKDIEPHDDLFDFFVACNPTYNWRKDADGRYYYQSKGYEHLEMVRMEQYNVDANREYMNTWIAKGRPLDPAGRPKF